MNTNPKTKRADAERAAEWYAREVLGCVITRRAVRTQWQAVDFFGSDVVGKLEDGSHAYIQATAGQSASIAARRRKLEAIPWLDSDIVQVVQLRWTEDPANARRKLWFFRVHEYAFGLADMGVPEDPDCDRDAGRWWTVIDEAVPVPRYWFTVWKLNHSR